MTLPYVPRCSSLDLALLCSLAPQLDSLYPECGRAAVMSSWLHAKSAGKREADHLWSVLDDDEREEVLTWFMPGDCETSDGHPLRFAEALKEVPVAVDRDFRAVAHGDPRAWYQGTLDFAWVETIDDMRVGYINDIKKSRFTVEGPDTLQLKSYALAGVAKWELDAYCTGLFIAEEGRWVFSPEGVITVGSAQWTEDMRRVTAAVENARSEPKAVTGSHCGSCYSRLHCPAYTSPPNEGALAPALSQALTPENGLAALVELKRLEKLCEAAKANIKEAVRRGLTIVDETGKKRWGAVRCQGKSSVSVKELVERYPDVAAAVTTTGTPFDRVQWVKR
jgi:hypothetical protein